MQDDQQRRILAFILCFALLILYKQFVFDPYFTQDASKFQNTAAPATQPPAPFQDPAANSQIAQTPSTTLPSAPPVELPAAPSTGYPSDSKLDEAGTYVIESPELRLEISRLGGRLRNVYLRHYREAVAKDSPPYNLVDHFELAPLPLGVYSGGESDAWVQYEVIEPAGLGVHSTVVISSDTRIVLRGELPDGRTLTKTLLLPAQGYLLDYRVETSAPAADGTRLELEWTRFLAEESDELTNHYNVSQISWFNGEKAQHQPLSGIEDQETVLGEVLWAGIGDNFFFASFISPGNPAYARVFNTSQLYRVRLSGADTLAEGKLYAGPKKYELLQDIGYELRRSVSFGWTAFVAAPLTAVLHFFYGIFGNYGLSIIALTLLVKAATYPLNSAAFKQMKAMQALSPELKRIQEGTKDKQQKQLEMMALYKKHNVNPLGGCLPMLVQIPIFFGLYTSLSHAVELRHAPFALWVNDLSAPERLHIFGIGIPVLVIIYMGCMLLQQWLTPTPNMDPTQRRIMMFMPLMFGFLFFTLPGGLTVYFLVNSIMSIAQQQAFYRSEPRMAMRVTAAAGIGLFAFAFVLTKIS